MKKRELLLNMFLLLLLGLVIFQSIYIWVDTSISPKIKKQSVSDANRIKNSSLFQDILLPQKMVANFGEHRHCLLYDFDNIFIDNIDFFSEIFSACVKDNLNPISAREYIEAQNERSLVFKFNNYISDKIFSSILKFLGDEKEVNLVGVREIYLSQSKILIKSHDKFYRLNSINKLNMPTILNDIELRGYKNYNNFYEIYGLDKNIYLPQKEQIVASQIYYSSNLAELEASYKSNLAERFFNQNIEYIREITQNEGSSFVYENKFLRFLNDGLIEYENSGLFKAPDRNLYVSLRASLNFIALHRGGTKDLYLAGVEEIESYGNKGYKFSFNLKKNSIPLISFSEFSKSYIEMEVYSDFIRLYKQLYRKPVNEIREELIETVSLERLIENNGAIFLNDSANFSVNEILKNIDDINLVYFDELSNLNPNQPILSIRILYKGRNLYFYLSSGNFLMEK